MERAGLDDLIIISLGSLGFDFQQQCFVAAMTCFVPMNFGSLAITVVIRTLALIFGSSVKGAQQHVDGLPILV